MCIVLFVVLYHYSFITFIILFNICNDIPCFIPSNLWWFPGNLCPLLFFKSVFLQVCLFSKSYQRTRFLFHWHYYFSVSSSIDLYSYLYYFPPYNCFGLFCFSFPRLLRWELRISICDFSTFLRYAFTALKFSALLSLCPTSFDMLFSLMYSFHSA